MECNGCARARRASEVEAVAGEPDLQATAGVEDGQRARCAPGVAEPRRDLQGIWQVAADRDLPSGAKDRLKACE